MDYDKKIPADYKASIDENRKRDSKTNILGAIFLTTYVLML
ncbi:hypothetical protein [Streptococcus suis]